MPTRSSAVPDSTLSDNWLLWAVSAMLSALIAYFTTTGTLRAKLAQLEERESNHYLELKALLQDMRADLKTVVRRQE